MRKLLRLLQYARPHLAAWLLVAVLTLLGAVLAALQPWPMALLFDQILGQAPPPASLRAVLHWLSLPPTRTVLLLTVVLGGLALFVLYGLVDAALTWVWTGMGRRMVYHLAQDLFARIQRRSLQFHKRHTVADLMSRVTADSWCAYQLTDTLVFSPAHAALMTAMMILLMARLDLTLTALAVALAPLMVAASFLLGRPLRAAAQLKRDLESRIQAHIQQTLTGIPVVQAFGQEEVQSSRFESFADSLIRSQQRSALLSSINGLSSGLVTTLGSGIILWVGARHVLTGSLSLGSILIFLSYLISLQAQIRVLAGVYPAAQGLSASARRALEILDAQDDLPEKAGALRLQSSRGQIELQGVTTGYEPGSPVLHNLSLEVRPGQMVAIVGPTGAGKSTLVSLVPRFIDAWQGRVLLDGHDVRELKLESLRDQIGLVLQDCFLFPVSLRENIAYGRLDATAEEVEAAARAANIHEFIVQQPDGYDTVVGERGATLSGGQRQRLAIARALLKAPPILILDEPTSALDAQTEHLVMEALERLMHGRTTLVIAHRLSTVRRADKIVVLKGGRLVESGTHEELLARDGHYAHLHQLQHQPVGAVALTT